MRSETNNCLVGISDYASTKDKIAFILAIKGFYEEGDYSIRPIELGDYNLFTVKNRKSPVNQIYEDLSDAINIFLKLTSNTKIEF